MDTMEFGMSEIVTHYLGPQPVSCVFPINKAQVVAITLREVIIFEREEIVSRARYSFTCACYIPEETLIVGHTYRGCEFVAMQTNNLDNPILESQPSGHSGVYHMIYSPKSKVIITIGSGIKVWDIECVDIGNRMVSAEAKVLITPRVSFAEKYETPILQNPVFDYDKELLFLPTLGGIMSFSIDGNPLEYVTRVPANTMTIFSYCPSNKKCITFTPDTGFCVWRKECKLEKKLNTVGSTLLAISFIDSENVIYLNTKGSLFIVNIKSGRQFHCFDTLTRPSRYFLIELYNQPCVAVATSNVLKMLNVTVPWKVWKMNILKPKYINRHSKLDCAARIVVFTDNSFIKMFNPKTRSLINAATPGEIISPLSFYYDRGMFTEYIFDQKEGVFTEKYIETGPRDSLLVAYDNGILVNYDCTISPCSETWEGKLNAAFLEKIKYQDAWCYAVGRGDGGISFLNYDTFELIKTISICKDKITGMLYHYPSNCLLILVYNSMKLIDLESEIIIDDFKIKHTDVFGLRGDIVYMGYRNGEIVKYNISGKAIKPYSASKSITPHSDKVSSFHFGLQYYISASFDNSLIIWDYYHSTISRVIIPFPIYSVSFLGAFRQILIGLENEIMILNPHQIFNDDVEAEIPNIDNYDKLVDLLDPRLLAAQRLKEYQKQARLYDIQEGIKLNSPRRSYMRALENYRIEQAKLQEEGRKIINNGGSGAGIISEDRNRQLPGMQGSLQNNQSPILQTSIETPSNQQENKEANNDKENYMKHSSGHRKRKEKKSATDFLNDQLEKESARKKVRRKKVKKDNNQEDDDKESSLDLEKTQKLLDSMNTDKSPKKSNKAKTDVDISKMNFHKNTMKNEKNSPEKPSKNEKEKQSQQKKSDDSSDSEHNEDEAKQKKQHKEKSSKLKEKTPKEPKEKPLPLEVKEQKQKPPPKEKPPKEPKEPKENPPPIETKPKQSKEPKEKKEKLPHKEKKEKPPPKEKKPKSLPKEKKEKSIKEKKEKPAKEIKPKSDKQESQEHPNKPIQMPNHKQPKTLQKKLSIKNIPKSPPASTPPPPPPSRDENDKDLNMQDSFKNNSGQVILLPDRSYVDKIGNKIKLKPGESINENGEIITLKNNENISNGKVVNLLPNGQFVNDKGQLVNAQGQLINEKGEVLAEGEPPIYIDINGQITVENPSSKPNSDSHHSNPISSQNNSNAINPEQPASNESQNNDKNISNKESINPDQPSDESQNDNQNLLNRDTINNNQSGLEVPEKIEEVQNNNDIDLQEQNDTIPYEMNLEGKIEPPDPVIVDEKGNVLMNLKINEDGKVVNENGDIIDNIYVDKNGHLVNENGQYVNSNGELVNASGKVKYSNMGSQYEMENEIPENISEHAKEQIINFRKAHPANPERREIKRPETPPPIAWTKKALPAKKRPSTPLSRKKPEFDNLPPPNIVLDPEAVMAMFGHGHNELLPLVERIQRDYMLYQARIVLPYMYIPKDFKFRQSNPIIIGPRHSARFHLYPRYSNTNSPSNSTAIKSIDSPRASIRSPRGSYKIEIPITMKSIDFSDVDSDDEYISNDDSYNNSKLNGSNLPCYPRIPPLQTSSGMVSPVRKFQLSIEIPQRIYNMQQQNPSTLSPKTYKSSKFTNSDIEDSYSKLVGESNSKYGFHVKSILRKGSETARIPPLNLQRNNNDFENETENNEKSEPRSARNQRPRSLRWKNVLNSSYMKNQNPDYPQSPQYPKYPVYRPQSYRSQRNSVKRFLVPRQPKTFETESPSQSPRSPRNAIKDYTYLLNPDSSLHKIGERSKLPELSKSYNLKATNSEQEDSDNTS